MMTGNNKINSAKQRKVANNMMSAKYILKATSWGVHTVQKCSCQSGRNWADLDPNLLEEILSRVPIHDLSNAAFVCQSWKEICCNMLFSRHNVLDLSAAGVGFHPDSSTIEPLHVAESRHLPGLFEELQSGEQYNRIAKSLSRLLELALGGDSLQNRRFSINTIILPHDFEISNEHLVYIAQRTFSLKHLILLNTRRITVPAFRKATFFWSHLKEIHLGSMDGVKCAYFLLVLGMNCQQLEYLHLHQRGLVIDEINADSIVSKFPTVKKIEFDSCWILPCTLKSFFLRGINVEELQFTRCGLVAYANSDDFCSDQLYDPARLVENFALSWTESSGGYPKWHPKFTSDDDSSAIRVEAWLLHQVPSPSRQDAEN